MGCQQPGISRRRRLPAGLPMLGAACRRILIWVNRSESGPCKASRSVSMAAFARGREWLDSAITKISSFNPVGTKVQGIQQVTIRNRCLADFRQSERYDRSAPQSALRPFGDGHPSRPTDGATTLAPSAGPSASQTPLASFYRLRQLGRRSNRTRPRRHQGNRSCTHTESDGHRPLAASSSHPFRDI